LSIENAGKEKIGQNAGNRHFAHQNTKNEFSLFHPARQPFPFFTLSPDSARKSFSRRKAMKAGFPAERPLKYHLGDFTPKTPVQRKF